MTKDEIQREVSMMTGNNLLLELATGTGKTKGALMNLAMNNALGNVLIVAPQLKMQKNWEDEINKWGYSFPHKYVTYVPSSLQKIVDSKEQFSAIILDEVHHCTPRVLSILPNIITERRIMLSATVSYNLRSDLKNTFGEIQRYRVHTKDAIDNGILPEPKVVLVPIRPNNDENEMEYVFHPKAKQVVYGTLADFNKYRYNSAIQFHMKCSQRRYLNLLQNAFDNAYRAKRKNQMVFYGGKILNDCAKMKEPYAIELLKQLKDYRTLTFCLDIEQTEKLGTYCINSKNFESDWFLDMFNNRKIKHITACKQLDEGMNLTDCKVGVFVKLNTSERLTCQRVGRLMRHPSPVLVVMYMQTQREEVAVDKFLNGISRDSSNVSICFDVKKIKEYL